MGLYNQKGIQAVFQESMDFDTLLFQILDLLERALPQSHRLPCVASACESTVVCQVYTNLEAQFLRKTTLPFLSLLEFR